MINFVVSDQPLNMREDARKPASLTHCEELNYFKIQVIELI
jgi:hypothetical protein